MSEFPAARPQPPSEPPFLSGDHDPVPIPQIVSFVNHDLYGPASMLRTYLRAISDTSADEEVRALLLDAERLASQLEGMLSFLQVSLKMDCGMTELSRENVSLASFLENWARENPRVGFIEEEAETDPSVRLLIDPRAFSMALGGAVWQLARMGARQGEVTLGTTCQMKGDGGGEVCVKLWRADDALPYEILERAVSAREDDWLTFTRRLPACGFPLRVACRLISRMGGVVEVHDEPACLRLVFSQGVVLA